MREVVEADPWRGVRVGRHDAHVAAAARPVVPEMHLEAVAPQCLGAVVAHGGRQKVELHVRPLPVGGGPQERTGLEVVGAAEPVPEQQPAQADTGLAQGVQPAVQGDGFEAPILAIDFQVILQVLTHAGQLVPQRHPGIGQYVRGTDAGALQQRRRTDGARRQDDLSRGVGLDNAGTAAQADAGRDAAIAPDRLRGRARHHGQVRPGAGRREVGAGCRRTHAAVDGHRQGAEPLLPVAVAVFRACVTRLPSCRHERRVERVAPSVVAAARAQRPVAAAKRVRPALPGLGAPEVREAVAVVPAGRAERFPRVEVAPVSAHVHHAVDGRGAAEHLAPGAVEAPPPEARLRFGHEPPVASAKVHRLREGGRHPDEEVVVASARLHEQHAALGNHRQSVRQDATRRAGANHDVVVAGPLHGRAVTSRGARARTRAARGPSLRRPRRATRCARPPPGCGASSPGSGGGPSPRAGSRRRRRGARDR